MDPAKRTTYIIAAIAFVILAVAIYFLFIFQRSPKGIETEEEAFEVKQLADLGVENRPYVTLTPTSDAAEIIISIERMDFFDKIEYELTYLADNPQVSGEKIQRGSTGTDINTKDSKYKKSILLGTASRGVRSPDKGIEEGKLSLHLFKGETEYLSETDWDLLTVGARATTVENRTGDLKLEVTGLAKDYPVIVADTVGIPPQGEFDIKNAVLPVWGIFSVSPSFKKEADLEIKVSGDLADPELYAFVSADSKWQKLDAKFNATTKTFSTSVASFATFVVVSQPK